MPGGKLTIDECDVTLSRADCRLFAGRLDLEFGSPHSDWSCHNIPCGDKVEFADVHGCTVSMANCENALYENPIFKPMFSIDRECYPIQSFQIDSIKYDHRSNVLSLDLKFIALDGEAKKRISVHGAITAECCAIDAHYLIHCHQTFPVRFAAHYLPVLGLPAIGLKMTRSDAVNLFGPPDKSGGGVHQYGEIPRWDIYALPEFFLRLQFESDAITHVTIMPRTGPFALSWP